MLDHLTISIIRHRRIYRNFHHQISGFTNAGDSQISINRAMCGLLDAYASTAEARTCFLIASMSLVAFSKRRNGIQKKQSQC
jgi:hypothetical protein